MSALLEVKELEVVIETKQKNVYVINNIDFFLNMGETVGLVGESGSGKSMTCRSILQLLPQPYGKIVKGEIRLSGKNLVDLTEKEMQKVRGKEIGMVLQDPMSSLDPVYKIGEQIVEALQTHNKMSKKKAWERAEELLRLVRMPSPEKRVKQYPHELSGGMRQRVMIALAISSNPKLLLADEPTTALDVTVQDQVLNLLKELQKEFGMGILLVTHNLGVVAEVCDRVVVMYAGKVMEMATTEQLFKSPRHAYTLGLINSVPRLESKVELEGIPGTLPDMSEPIQGCPFHNRCKFATDDCLNAKNTRLIEIESGHWTSCVHHERVSDNESRYFKG